jgi:hypothetical protein
MLAFLLYDYPFSHSGVLLYEPGIGEPRMVFQSEQHLAAVLFGADDSLMTLVIGEYDGISYTTSERLLDISTGQLLPAPTATPTP